MPLTEVQEQRIRRLVKESWPALAAMRRKVKQQEARDPVGTAAGKMRYEFLQLRLMAPIMSSLNLNEHPTPSIIKGAEQLRKFYDKYGETDDPA